MTLVIPALSRNPATAIEVSSGTPASGERNPLRRGISLPEEEAYNLPAATAIRLKVRCPLMVVGGIRSYWTAKGIIRRGEADFISRCRPLIHEPHLPQCWQRAEGETLARCRSCCNGCLKTALKGSLSCITATPHDQKPPGECGMKLESGLVRIYRKRIGKERFAETLFFEGS